MTKKKYLIDFPMTIYATEVIEADNEEQAKEMAEKLLDSWEFFCERLYPDYRDVDVHENWENCEEPLIQDGFGRDITMDADVINDFIGE